MTLRERVNILKQCSITKLSLDGQVIGFRVKSFVPDKGSFIYFDVDLGTLREDKRLYQKLKGISVKLSVECLIRCNGKLVTESELRSQRQIEELSSSAILPHIRRLVVMYERGHLDGV